jgi:uncharacterized protein
METPNIEIFGPETYVLEPWRNGMGTTTELVRSDDIDGNFVWRLSIAGVSNDGLFSNFDGYERTLVLLDGVGMKLEHSKSGVSDLRQRFDVAWFEGGESTMARLVNGPITDFNVMTRRNNCRANVEIITTDAGELLCLRSDLVFIYAAEESTLTERGYNDVRHVLSEQFLMKLINMSGRNFLVASKGCIVIQLEGYCVTDRRACN